MRFIAKYLLVLGILMQTLSGWAQGQDFTARSKMKSLFIYNFATKYVEWPADRQTGNFIIGVYGISSMFEELKRATDGKKVNSRDIEIRLYDTFYDIKKCHIIFIPYDKAFATKDLSNEIGNSAILVIPEKEYSLENGSDINFIMLDEKMKFEINQIQLNQKSLNVARDMIKLSVNTITDASKLIDIKKTTLEASGKLLLIDPVKTEVAVDIPLPEVSDKNWELQYAFLEMQFRGEQEIVKRQKEELGQTIEKVDLLGKENEEKQALLIEKTLMLDKQEKQLAEVVMGLRQMKNEIKIRETKIESQKDEMERKQRQISNQDIILNKQFEDINKQKFIIYSASGLLGLVLVFIFFMVRAGRQRQKAFRIISLQKQEVEKAKKIIEEKNQDIISSIQYAQRIQQTILPPFKIVKQYLENSFILFKPRDIVSGDFYWMHCLGDGNSDKILFAVVDCTGHGVPDAFVSIVGYNGLNRAVNEFGLTEPAQILDKLNEIVEDHFSKSENEIKDYQP